MDILNITSPTRNITFKVSSPQNSIQDDTQTTISARNTFIIVSSPRKNFSNNIRRNTRITQEIQLNLYMNLHQFLLFTDIHLIHYKQEQTTLLFLITYRL